MWGVLGGRLYIQSLLRVGANMAEHNILIRAAEDVIPELLVKHQQQKISILAASFKGVLTAKHSS